MPATLVSGAVGEIHHSQFSHIAPHRERGRPSRCRGGARHTRAMPVSTLVNLGREGDAGPMTTNDTRPGTRGR